MREQSALGANKAYTCPTYNLTQIGRVISTGQYKKYGMVEVVFNDYSKPFPVWVVSEVDRQPIEGDMVLVGFIQGRHDAPYLMGYIRNESYTSNYISIEKDRIILQIPTSDADKKAHLLEDSGKDTRVYVEVKASEVVIHAPTVLFNHGSKGVARLGDTVKVSVPTIGECTGTITSASTSIKVE